MPNNQQERNTKPPIRREAAETHNKFTDMPKTPPDVVLPTRKTRSNFIHRNTSTIPLHQETYIIH